MVAMLRNVLLGLVCLAGLTPAFAGELKPMDVTEGYLGVKWGESAEKALKTIQGQPGLSNASLEQSPAEGIDGAVISAKRDGGTLFLSFINDKFYSFAIEDFVALKGYYTPSEIRDSKLADEAKKLFKTAEGTDLYSSVDVRGTTGERVTDVGVKVICHNTKLKDAEIAKAREKNPGMREEILGGLVRP